MGLLRDYGSWSLVPDPNCIDPSATHLGGPELSDATHSRSTQISLHFQPWIPSTSSISYYCSLLLPLSTWIAIEIKSFEKGLRYFSRYWLDKKIFLIQHIGISTNKVRPNFSANFFSEINGKRIPDPPRLSTTSQPNLKECV